MQKIHAYDLRTKPGYRKDVYRVRVEGVFPIATRQAILNVNIPSVQLGIDRYRVGIETLVVDTPQVIGQNGQVRSEVFDAFPDLLPLSIDVGSAHALYYTGGGQVLGGSAVILEKTNAIRSVGFLAPHFVTLKPVTHPIQALDGPLFPNEHLSGNIRFDFPRATDSYFSELVDAGVTQFEVTAYLVFYPTE